MRGVRRVCAQRADDGQMIGIRLACSSCLLSAFCTHTIPCLPCAKREHNRRIVQGSKVLCLLKEREVRPLYPLSGGVRHRYRSKWPHFVPDSPRLSLVAVLMVLQIYADLSFVGGPDPRYATCQFIPFDPFLAVACYGVCSRTYFLASERCRLVHGCEGAKR